jgi:hypothetical protein
VTVPSGKEVALDSSGTGSFVMVSVQDYNRLRTADEFRRDHFPVMVFAAVFCIVSVVAAVYAWWRLRTAETLLCWKKESAEKELGLR